MIDHSTSTLSRPSYLFRFAFLSLVSLVAACTAPAEPDLRQATQAMKQLATARTLQRSCFYVAYPDGLASDFVDYLFSPLGAGDWPPIKSDGSGEDPAFIEMMAFEAEQAKAIGLEVLPGNVKVSRLEREDADAKELVLRGDDQKGLILALGYLPDESEPVFETGWKLAKAAPGEGVRQMCESNIEMGIDVRPTSPREEW